MGQIDVRNVDIPEMCNLDEFDCEELTDDTEEDVTEEV